MNYDTYILPSYWASYIINGDASGLDNVELDIIKQWEKAAGVKLQSCLGCSDEEQFIRHHSVYPEVLACNCLEYYFKVKEE